MTPALSRVLALAAMLVPAASAQFQLLVVDAAGERAAPAAYDLGTAYPGEPAAALLRVRNVSKNKASLTRFVVNGAGFTLAGGPALPVPLDPGAAADFSAAFRATQAGSYSAAVESDGLTTLLLAAVPARPTVGTDTGGAIQALPAALDFGTVERASSATRRIVVLNQQNAPLAIPPIAARGADFSVAGQPSAGATLAPGDRAAFDVRFTPQAAGAHSGALEIGERVWVLAGTGVEPPLPAPTLALTLAEARSARQGSVAVKFDAPARTTGSGTVSLDFRPASGLGADQSVAFASGGRTAAFTVAAGDTEARFPAAADFQTGTTAGTLVFTVELGGKTDQRTVPIAAAPVGVASAKGVRSPGSIALDISGFDNTRTAGPLAFTFFDASGAPIGAAIRADAGAAFSSWFAGSGLGGVFLLHAVFPVTGDAARIASFEIQFTNTAGAAQAARTNF